MRFNPQQQSKLADLCGDVAQVSLASIVIPVFVDKFDLMMLALGLVLTFISWSAALFVLRKR